MSEKPNVNVEVVDVTPQTATKWLEHNRNNRNIRDQHVELLARDMREGHWKFNGDTVRFDEHGNLADGQHRLWAILHSGTTQQMLVVRGITEDAFDTIDSGALRTSGDALKRRGFHLGPHVAACVRILKWYHAGRIEWNVHRRMTHTEIVEYAMDNEGIQMAVDRVKYSPQFKKLSAGAPLAAITFLAYKNDPDLAEQFLIGVEGGEGLSEGDARRTYREWMLHKHQQSIRYQMPIEFSITARAFNAYAADKPVKLLRFDEKMDIPAIITPGPVQNGIGMVREVPKPGKGKRAASTLRNNMRAVR
jgi:hypothetical protein